MNARSMVVAITCLAVAALAGVFASMQWDQANRLAGVLVALVGLASLGVAVWAGLSVKSRKSKVVVHSGAAKAAGHGKANTGIAGRDADEASMEVRDSGRAEASGDGEANTGIS